MTDATSQSDGQDAAMLIGANAIEMALKLAKQNPSLAVFTSQRAHDIKFPPVSWLSCVMHFSHRGPWVSISETDMTQADRWCEKLLRAIRDVAGSKPEVQFSITRNSNGVGVIIIWNEPVDSRLCVSVAYTLEDLVDRSAATA